VAGAIALLFVFQLVGEAVHRLARVPVPGPVIGMVLLAAWLALRRRDNPRLTAVSSWLTGHLSLMFVPAAVGVMEQGAIFARFGIALVVATAVSVVLTIVVTALVLRWALARFAPDGAAA
jgi:holin-like protein